ncbi:MAG: sigma 54-interacting transcriptional regulator [Sandaracinus sp.]|nr:sigma 54-interacting transcriptional regulator [Sandaracinus sp.]MCB9615006.1 sigma 54-interacting transcriptional regulator [Sandaracinus sp.]MCB9618506.1 sigma 54-interacting transcriptional regulator [Sandaracinus sp.]MCB9622068.1 sigma 54-interacting transcriptional regulator [Sandaracinus sp.]
MTVPTTTLRTPRAHLDAPLHLVSLVGESMRTHRLPERGVVVLGRDDDADVTLRHESVSRRHAELRLDAEGVFVRDLQSKNGTWVGSMHASEDVEITPGSAIRLGDVTLLLQRGTGASMRDVALPHDTSAVTSPAMAVVQRAARCVAGDDITVLLLGETGVGKEITTERIHAMSPRCDKPLVRVHCAAITESLFESELFGHERGAFTGAVGARAGLLEQAHGGTVFIDEVGELPLATQVKLLRVLEDRRVRRVGGRDEREVDVRFVAATNRDLELEVAEGRFRRDLYFRLAGFTIRIPPLRERSSEILPLARAFVAELCEEKGRPVPRFDGDLEKALLAYPWPGNVRELKALARRLLVVGEGDVLRASDLPHDEMAARLSMMESSRPPSGVESRPPSGAEPRPPSDFPPAPSDERERVIAALDQTNGNQTEAAKLLGVSRRTLIARLDKLGISGPRKRR